MRSEVLKISPKRILVDYEFFNDSPKDVETTVAFPFAGLQGFYEGELSRENQFDDFLVETGGKKIATKLRYRALQDGKDVTSELVKLGIAPENHALAGVPADKLKILGEKGLTQPAPEGGGVWPNFEVQASRYWTQTFPSRRSLKSRHEYTPSLGGNSIGHLNLATKNIPHPYPSPGKEPPSGWAPWIEAPGWSVFYEKGFEPFGEKCWIGSCGKYSASYVSYILSTGSNWKNGIEDFTLKVDGAALILVDIDGRMDFDLGSYSFHKRAFKPKQELNIEFVGSGMRPSVPADFPFEKEIDGPANCRATRNGKTLASLADREKVKLLERDGLWYRVAAKARTCWTHRKNLRFLPEAATR